MQSFNLTRLQDSQTQPAAQSQNVGPLPLYRSIPPKTPRCINPLVEARWAPAIVGSDRIMGDISGSRSKGPLRTLFPMKFMTVHTFTSKKKKLTWFTHSISIISDPFHANPRYITLEALLDISNPRIPKNTILKRLIDHICCVRSMIHLIPSKQYPLVDCRSYMITQSAESHLSHSKESIQQTLMLASKCTYIHTYIKI